MGLEIAAPHPLQVAQAASVLAARS